MSPKCCGVVVIGLLAVTCVASAKTVKEMSCSELLTECKTSIEMYTSSPVCDDALREAIEIQQGMCLPQLISMSHLKEQFVIWAEHHPEAMSMDGPSCMTKALEDTYPCYFGRLTKPNFRHVKADHMSVIAPT